MKRQGFLYEKICDTQNIKNALISASKNKTKKFAVKNALKSFDKSVDLVRDILANKTYIPNRYYQATIIDGITKKERTIYKPKFFPDQIIHWALINVIKPLLVKSMYHWSCASIPSRGPHYAKKACEKWIRTDYKNTKYCLKLDIKKYYPNINKDILKSKFRRIIKDPETLWLVDLIIDSHHEGLPIGNYTSQWFANFYLQNTDHYIKEKLGVKYYIRYMDDLVLFGGNKRELHKTFEKLQIFLGSEDLEIKGNWQLFNATKRGLDFCGFCFSRRKTFIRKRISRRMRTKYFSFQKNANRHNAAALTSYYGWVVNTDSYVLYIKYYKNIMAKIKEALRLCY
ncbi:MAG: RNA-directed DNA polymerase [Bacteroidales bacterium]|jgi:hypothetical protein